MKHEIQEMVDRETQAWNMKDAEALVSIFHPDILGHLPLMLTIPLNGSSPRGALIVRGGNKVGRSFSIHTTSYTTEEDSEDRHFRGG